jgi:hypothetical protein
LTIATSEEFFRDAPSPLRVLCLSPARALMNLITYAALKCWATVNRPLRGRNKLVPRLRRWYPKILHLAVLILLRAVLGWASNDKKLKFADVLLSAGSVAKPWQLTQEPGPGSFGLLPV